MSQPKTKKRDKKRVLTILVPTKGCVKNLNSVQKGIGNIQKALGLLQDIGLGQNKNTPSTYEPRPLYQHFDD